MFDVDGRGILLRFRGRGRKDWIKAGRTRRFEDEAGKEMRSVGKGGVIKR